MTPSWRELAKRLLKTRDTADDLWPALAAKCFDMRDAQEVAWATGNELIAAFSESPQGADWAVDIGERAVMPADNFWIEFPTGFVFWVHRQPDGRWLVFSVAQSDEPGDPYRLRMATLMDDGDGLFRVTVDGEFLDPQGRKAKALARLEALEALGPLEGEDAEYLAEIRSGETDEVPRKFAVENVATLMAAVALINSPAVERVTAEPHRGLAKHLRQGTPYAGASATRIVIGATSRRTDGNGGGLSHPRAYHFCRAHTRLKNGKVERVRAHWRGDRAFGFRIGSYKVTA